MLRPRLEVTSMEKFAGLFSVLTLACGLAVAQTDSPQSAAAAGTRATTGSSSSAGTPGAVMIQQWRGTLVDASCSGTKNSSSSSESSTSDQNASVDTGRPHKGHRNRAGKTSEPGCAVASSTSMFALQTDNGQVMRFDAIGNARAAEALKSKEKWTKDLSANKPIHAKVSGTMAGDTITVTSID